MYVPGKCSHLHDNGMITIDMQQRCCGCEQQDHACESCREDGVEVAVVSYDTHTASYQNIRENKGKTK